MIRNYFILAVRNLLKRKLYSFINIFGLAVGTAVCLVILKYVEFELSYDNFDTNGDAIYRSLATDYRAGEKRATSNNSPYARGPALLNDIPEVKTYVRIHPMYGGAVVSYDAGKGEPIRFQEWNMLFADSTFLNVFSYDLVKGDPATALNASSSILISELAADRYFGKDNDPIGKTMTLSGGWADGDYQVTGVLKNVPENSHLSFDFLMPLHKLLDGQQYKQPGADWGWHNFSTYIQLNPHTDIKKVEAKMPAFVDKYLGKDLAKSNSKLVMTFQPLRKIHLIPDLNNEKGVMDTIYFFILISIFILAIAWVNNINLSTARAMERAREVGVKKSIGALRSQLISQFIFESVLVNFLGVMLAMGLAMLLLPVLGNIMGKHFSFDFTDYHLWLILTGLFVTGAFISGAYPAFVLSSFNPAEVIKGSVEKIKGGMSLRKVLVIFQFTASLVLIAGTFTIYRQMQFMQKQDKGFNMEQMLVINGPRVIEREGMDERLVSFKNELQKISSIMHVTSSGVIPGGGYNWGTSMRKDGTPEEENKFGSVMRVDPDFIDTYDMKLMSGKVWNPDVVSEMKAVLINEAALKAFGFGTAEQTVGEKMIIGGDTAMIQGVMKNYHWNSPKSEHTPMVLMPGKVFSSLFSMKLAGHNMQESIKQVEKVYKEAFPGNPFNYYFADESYNNQYKADQQFGKIFSLFAVLAIVIACLGLWGLASFTTTQKLKEISIRKVLGASVSSILTLLSGQFMSLVLIASIIALPITWYGVTKWLSGFAFRINFTWDLYLVPVMVLGLIALITVSFRIFRGANSNPAAVLRTE